MEDKVNLAETLGAIEERFSPKIIGELRRGGARAPDRAARDAEHR